MQEPDFGTRSFKLWSDRDGALRCTYVEITSMDREGNEKEGILLAITDKGKIVIVCPPQLLEE